MTDSIPAPRYGLWQSIGVAVRLGTRALEEVQALKAAPPSAKFPVATFWAEGVHYKGDFVTHKGSAYQAARDTGREPPHEDWLLIAACGQHGRDAPVGEVCGLYDAARQYRRFDLVTLNGSEWRAKRDDPGALPGDGWAIAAQPGKRGEKGERGERGVPGAAAVTIVGWNVRDFKAVPIMSDGTLGPALDLRQLFERYHAEAAE
jgi:hypothetical protein